DEAEYVCCALKHVQKLGSPHRPTYACSGWIPPEPTAKRSVTHAKTRPIACHKQWELDIKARLEKRIFIFKHCKPNISLIDALIKEMILSLGCLFLNSFD
ncbi:MAG: hypothetical protein OEU84_10135, partial [Xanthomonadales bacterium]|nr:hypothetical protein [Xanthomonadales bacterium]